MRLAFIVAVAGGLLAGLVLAFFRLSSDEVAAPSPISTVEPESPAATAEAFARAWESGDTEGIRSLLDPVSLVNYSADDIEDAYSLFLRELTVKAKEVAVDSVGDAGAKLTVRLETAYFGRFEYAINLPLILSESRYRVSWSEALLHPDLAGGRSFRSIIRRPGRGAILDRDGRVLAETRDTQMVGLNRSVVSDRASVSAALEQLGFTTTQVTAAFDSPLGPAQRVPVGAVPGEQEEAAIRAMETVPGVIVYFQEQRVHPMGPAAAQVVGYTREYTAEELAAQEGTGLRPGDRLGATGLEAALDRQLAGSIGAELRIVDRTGETVDVVFDQPFVEGADVTTTLDAEVQAATYSRMGDRAGAAVVLDPRTNEVLAMVSVPSYDPDAFESGDGEVIAAIFNDARGPLVNRATGGTYSAGSTFKLITGAAGLEAGVVGPSERIFCGWIWEGLDPPRRNWEGTQGPLTVAEGLMRSCNPVFYEIGLRLYNDAEGQLAAMARRFGFGAPTGVGLGEEPGLVPDGEWKEREIGEPWYPGDEVNLAIGQGALLITPLQLANAYSTFVAGSLRSPVILKGISSGEGEPLGLASAYHDLLLLGLELVTGPRGTAAATFSNAGYWDFAGKSGTAEDSGSQQHVLFVTFSPQVDPAALAAVVLDDGQSGSLEAGPIARDAVLVALAAGE
ncbi:MAG: penicillin-binding transpeptidase domain-containing protein [Dehalococcoidia bacterium]